MRFTPVMTLRRSGVYFRKTRSILRVLFSSTSLYVEMYPSSFKMRAISVLSFETGTSTRWCLAAAALRRRVRKSAMGSVCITLLPAGFHDAGNFSLQRHTAKTDSAHLELADIAARAAADAAAVAYPHLEFRLLERLGDFCCACHLLCDPFFAKRNAPPMRQLAALLVVLGAGGHGNVHALDLVHARVIDLREHQLVLQSQCVIPAAVEGILRQAAEVTHARQHYVAQAVEKFVHVLAAQSHRASDGHALANLEIRDGLFGPRDYGFLPGNLAELDGRSVQQFGVLAGFAEADVDRNFLQLGHGHHVFPPKALHQRGHRLAPVFFLQSALHRLLRPLLVQRRVAMAATAHFRAVRQDGMADARVLAAAPANHHHVRDVDSRFFLHDPALDVLRRVGTRVPLDDADVLDHHGVLLRVDRKHAPALAGVFSGNHLDVIALADLNRVPFGSFVSECHGLPNLRSQRNNLREFLLAQLARHRAEHARPDGLARIVDQHRSVVVEPDVRAIFATPFFAHAHYHRFHYRSFFDLAFRRRFLDRGGDDVAEAGLQSRVAAHRHDAGQLARAGIVGHRQPGSHLNHWSAPLSFLRSRRVPRQHFFQPPALQLRKRPRGHDAHRVAGFRDALFVVRVKLFRDAHHAAVLGVLHQPLHLDYNRFFHLRAGHFAGENGALAALGNRGALRFACHYAFPAFSSCARTSVFTRARSFFASRSRFSASACPVESWKRKRKIVSVKSFCCASSSSTPASRIFSIRRGIVKTLLHVKRISWESAACAPRVPRLPWPSLRPLPPSRT